MKPMVVQIDFCYTFTKKDEKAAAEEEEEQRMKDDGAGVNLGEPYPPPEKKVPEYLLQYGLHLVAADSEVGWLMALPLEAKGSASLKKTAEAVTRMTMRIGGGDKVVVQGDPEPSIKQILNAVNACRARLGLETVIRVTPRAVSYTHLRAHET